MSTLSPVDSFRLDGRVAIVTGASSGLGDRFARVLDAAGANVVLAARRADRLEALATDLTDALVVPCDVADPDARSALVAATVAHHGHVDVLVNNAGTDSIAPAVDVPIEDFQRVMEVNLVAPFDLVLGGSRRRAKIKPWSRCSPRH